ncbi:MAG TPA: hypothetical protein VHF87_03215 [Methylomirabilota bacterium]|jgi:hypothetical protein|nr:hypothetical protein [Methylomirabilota bacterium]
MGFYLARGRGTAWSDLGASITWREYNSALAAATDREDPALERGRFGASVLPYLGVGPEETALAVLAEQVRRRPEDEVAQRLLGLTHLARGRHGAAARHLEIAFRLVRRHANRAVGLTDALRLQCEAATLRLVLVRLYTRLGNAERARSLARESQALL